MLNNCADFFHSHYNTMASNFNLNSVFSFLKQSVTKALKKFYKALIRHNVELKSDI